MCSTYVCKCSAQISDRDGANTRWIRRPYVFSHLNRFRQMHWTVDVNKVQVDICGPVHMIEYRVRTVKLHGTSRQCGNSPITRYTRAPVVILTFIFSFQSQGTFVIVSEKDVLPCSGGGSPGRLHNQTPMASARRALKHSY